MKSRSIKETEQRGYGNTMNLKLDYEVKRTPNTPRREGARYLAHWGVLKLQIDFARVDFPEPEIPQVIRTIVVLSSGTGAINRTRT